LDRFQLGCLPSFLSFSLFFSLSSIARLISSHFPLVFTVACRLISAVTVSPSSAVSLQSISQSADQSVNQSIKMEAKMGGGKYVLTPSEFARI